MSGPGDKIHVRCEDCDHSWVAAYLPMAMAKVAKLMGGIACPKCGAGTKRIVLSAPPADAQQGQTA